LKETVDAVDELSRSFGEANQPGSGEINRF
jgi:hypothetical protein